MNRMNENGNSHHLPREALMRKIQAIGFAKTEAGLYLDAYPGCTAALEYYNRLNEEYKMLAEQYENEYGALVQGGAPTDKWSWVEGIWPWQIESKEG